MSNPTERLAGLLQRFVSGEDRSKRLAGELEVAIDELFPEDDDWQDVVHALACYSPGGGPFLFDERQVEMKCRWALNSLLG